MSIHTLPEKIKSFIESEKGKDLLVILTIVCVSVSSFVLGKLSVVDTKTQKPVVVKFDPSITDYLYKENEGEGNPPTLSAQNIKNQDDILSSDEEILGTSSGDDTKSVSSNINDEKGDIVASSRGSKYYYTYCSGAKTLSESNKVYFSSEEEAEANGYSLSSSCTKK